jgi:Trypsin-co-occurring domain 1
MPNGRRDVPVILRTEDGSLYESDASGPAEVSFGRHGRLVRVETEIGRAINGLVSTIRGEIAASGASHATVEFGLKLDAEAGFVVSKGTTDAHLVLRLGWTQNVEDPSSELS